MLKLRTQDISWREVDDEIIVLDLRSSLYHSIDSVGAFLWQQLERGVTFDELVKVLREEYDVAEETAVTDVQAFLGSLEDLGLLESGSDR